MTKFDKPFFMKSKEEIKKELHQLIDSIEDENTLHLLNEDVVPYIIENSTEEGEEQLTEAQEKRLDEAIKQADEGKVISLDEFYRRMATWRTK